jgi:hypothetical protein
MTDQVADPIVDEPVEAKAPESILLDTAPVVVAPIAEAQVDPSGAIEYEPTGDVGLDMALNFVGKAGIDANHPAMLAAKDGDFSILKATLAAKGVQGWEQFVALGEVAYTRTAAEAEKKATAGREAVYKEAGGEENWSAIKAWAGTNATAEEKAEINALLNQGGLAARGAVQYLAGAYARANNVEVNPRDALANAAAGRGAQTATAGPLSSREYATAVQALNNKLGGRLEGSKEYADLQRRRSLHRG